MNREFFENNIAKSLQLDPTDKLIKHIKHLKFTVHQKIINFITPSTCFNESSLVYRLKLPQYSAFYESMQRVEFNIAKFQIFPPLLRGRSLILWYFPKITAAQLIHLEIRHRWLMIHRLWTRITYIKHLVIYQLSQTSVGERLNIWRLHVQIYQKIFLSAYQIRQQGYIIMIIWPTYWFRRWGSI